MFRFIYILSLLSFLFISCTDDLQQDTIQQPQINPDQSGIDEELILEYISNRSLIAIKDTSGLYYVIESEGEGEHPTTNSEVKVNYSGYLINGTEFDSGTLEYYPLSSLILGWQIGIPFLKPGGKAKFLLPSGLAYGPYSVGSIPANSVLVFDVELIDIK